MAILLTAASDFPFRANSITRVARWQSASDLVFLQRYEAQADFVQNFVPKTIGSLSLELPHLPVLHQRLLLLTFRRRAIHSQVVSWLQQLCTGPHKVIL